MVRRVLLASVFVGALSTLACAEPLTVAYTEPTASATLAHTSIYWCKGVGCTNWVLIQRVASDDGNGQDAKNVPVNIPLRAAELPVTIRVRVTATDTSGNETDGIIDTHTFSAS